MVCEVCDILPILDTETKNADLLACIMRDNLAVVDKVINSCLNINAVLKATCALQIKSAVISDKLFVGANFALIARSANIS